MSWELPQTVAGIVKWKKQLWIRIVRMADHLNAADFHSIDLYFAIESSLKNPGDHLYNPIQSSFRVSSDKYAAGFTFCGNFLIQRA